MTGLLVLAALWGTIAAHADKTCTLTDDNSLDVKSCVASSVPQPSAMCGPHEPAAEPGPVELGDLVSCANDMQNCACSLIGLANCSSITTSGQVVIGDASPADVKSKKLYLKKDPLTGEIMIMLDRKTAAQVSDAATYTNDDEIQKMKLEYHTDLYRLTTAIALLDSSRRLSENFAWAGRSSEKYSGLGDRALDPLSRELAVRALWQQINESIRACHAGQARPNPEEPDSALFYFRSNLVCALREGSSLAAHSVLMSWPGCSCHRGYGRMIGDTGACIQNDIRADRFAEQPIDERMPGMLGDFVKKLESRTGFKVKGVGTFGCGFERFETGYNVRHLGSVAKDEDRALRASHVSDHARGTACDLAYVTFRVDPCTEWTFKATTALDPGRTPGPASFPFHQALVKHLRASGMDPGTYLSGKKLIVRTGAGEFYRELEQSLSKGKTKTPADAGFGPADETALQLRIGAVIRDALTDAGFIVYDPTTNNVHKDHFHFEIPADDKDLGVLRAGDDLLPPKEREKVVDRYLQRAAGLVGIDDSDKR